MSLRIISRLFLLFVLLGTTAPVMAKQPVILVLGDSLSAAHGLASDDGWAALLQQRLVREKYPHQVVNISVSGETTAGGLARLPAAFAQYRPSIVVLELGANDGLRGLPLAEMRRNLAAMIKLARRHKARVLLIGMHIPPNYGEAYTRDFEDSYLNLAREQRTALVPFLLEGLNGDLTFMQEDGLHPRREAQPLMLEQVWPRLKPLLK